MLDENFWERVGAACCSVRRFACGGACCCRRCHNSPEAEAGGDFVLVIVSRRLPRCRVVVALIPPSGCLFPWLYSAVPKSSMGKMVSLIGHFFCLSICFEAVYGQRGTLAANHRPMHCLGRLYLPDILLLLGSPEITRNGTLLIIVMGLSNIHVVLLLLRLVFYVGFFVLV